MFKEFCQFTTDVFLQMIVWKIIYLNCRERYEDMIDHPSYTHNLSSSEIKAWKDSGLNGIRTHDLCDTSAELYTNLLWAIKPTGSWSSCELVIYS